MSPGIEAQAFHWLPLFRESTAESPAFLVIDDFKDQFIFALVEVDLISFDQSTIQHGSGKVIALQNERDGLFYWRGDCRSDECAAVVVFTACGREPGEDPYYSHCYRVDLDGSALGLLNPGNADHLISLSEDCTCFVDNCSRVDAIPTASLCTTTVGSGSARSQLEESDFSALSAAGFQFPEPFKAKSDDGVTDICECCAEVRRLVPSLP